MELFQFQVTMLSDLRRKHKKKKILNMPLEDRRKLYKCDDFIQVNEIYDWKSYYAKTHEARTMRYVPLPMDIIEYNTEFDMSMNSVLAEKVSLFRGDITKLEIDAIVSAANSWLMGGGGVDGKIHFAAGPLLQKECRSLRGCNTGEAKITGGYNLPAKYVIHTVGPRNGSAKDLRSCYEKSLAFHHKYNIKSIAFPCIATGTYGFENRLAAHIALRTTRKFLEANEKMERIVFCTYKPNDVQIYKTLMPMYFPVHVTCNYERAFS